MRPLGTGVSVRFIAEVRLQSILLLLLALTPASALRASPSCSPAIRVRVNRPVHVVALADRVRKRDRAKALFNRVRGKAPPPVEAASPPGAAFPAPPPPAPIETLPPQAAPLPTVTGDQSAAAEAATPAGRAKLAQMQKMLSDTPFISSIASSLPSVGGDVATPEELAALAAARAELADDAWVAASSDETLLRFARADGGGADGAQYARCFAEIPGLDLVTFLHPFAETSAWHPTPTPNPNPNPYPNPNPNPNPYPNRNPTRCFAETSAWRARVVPPAADRSWEFGRFFAQNSDRFQDNPELGDLAERPFMEWVRVPPGGGGGGGGGGDADARPLQLDGASLLILRPGRHRVGGVEGGGIDADTWLRLIAWHGERATATWAAPPGGGDGGGAEGAAGRGCVALIVDRTGSGLRNQDPTLLRALLPPLTRHFPYALHRAYVAPVNVVFRTIWKLVRLVLPRRVTERFELLSGDDWLESLTEELSETLGPTAAAAVAARLGPAPPRQKRHRPFS